MKIRLSCLEDLPQLMEIYDYARSLMRARGNMTQWINGYPSEKLIRSEIIAGHSWVCTDDSGRLLATFCFIQGEDPTYRRIYEGAWPNDEPYAVVHRMGTNGKVHGVAKACFDWCMKQNRHIRVDTHRDNKAMQHILTQLGFTPCGIIHTDDGTERIAYQRSSSNTEAF